jgi:hypothetical protein
MAKDENSLNGPGFSNHTPMMHGRKARAAIAFSGALSGDLY